MVYSVARALKMAATNLQSIYEYWRNFDLKSVQVELDEAAVEINNRQETGDKSRSKLVKLSREFKNCCSEEVKNAVAPLLKNFQSEIDLLSKRSKAAEYAFLTFYKKFIYVPDPSAIFEDYLSLQQKVSRLSDLEQEADRLRTSLEDYSKEIQQVRERDVTIEKLKERIHGFEDSIDKQLEEKYRDIQRELSNKLEEREKEFETSTSELKDNLNDAENRITSLQSALNNAQSELFDLKSSSSRDEKKLDKLNAMEVLMNDLNRSNQKVSIAEKEISHLKNQLVAANHSLKLANQIQKAPNMEQAIDVLTRSSLEVELAAKEKEISQLLEDVQRLQMTVSTLKESSASQIAQLEKVIEGKNQIIQNLEEKMDNTQDHDHMTNSLSNYKSPEAQHVEEGAEVADSILDMTRPKSVDSISEKSKRTGSVSPVDSTDDNNDEAISSIGEIITKNSPHGTRDSSPSRIRDDDDNSSSCKDFSIKNELKFESPTPEPLRSPTQKNGTPVPCPSLDKLHELIRINMDRYAHDTLNTLNISRGVRELLSVHNIGQRLFAKFVLGLSQGTVSELLSKPKPWDKLTEKGRDSYRKMHAWASDESCIQHLKVLIPRRGNKESPKESSLQTSSRRDDPITEERIAQILSEAQQLSNNNSVKMEDKDKCDDSETSESNRDNLSGNGTKRGGRYENDDIPHEMVSKIYQEELDKMGKRIEEFSKDQYAKTQDEIELALKVYHQELSRLNQLHEMRMNGKHSLNGNFDKERDSSSLPGGRFGESPSPYWPNMDSVLRHVGSAFSLVRPKPESPKSHGCCRNSSPPNSVLPMSANDESNISSTNASPLQRMQSITNSLISPPSLPSVLPSSNQRSMRAVLPPITQQQFDQYNNLNTEEIVKQVKEQLSQFSISQRLFGESVLGLSQGSVSDLLARPKPWHMLTQKGREPFIRMSMFLQDENAVHKLVASQYKIAPEKLMRTSGYPHNSPGSSKVTMAPSGPDTPHHHPHHQREYSNHLQSSSQHPVFHQQASHHYRHDLSRSSSSTPSDTPACIASTITSTALSFSAKKHSGMRSLNQNQPSVYEMAALTTDLDTQLITSKIKETLLANNIGQKIFGEAVLGLSQGSVSELLSKPKPWHMLSIKGREPFIRMQLWLNDPQNIERLQTLKNERREANKRKRANPEMLEPLPPPQSPECRSVHSHQTSLYQNSLNSYLPPSPNLHSGPAAKKARVLFSEEQKEALRLAFQLDPYPSTVTIDFLASELNLSARTITNWFHNHRMRLKQQQVPINGAPSQDSDNSKSPTATTPPLRTEGLKFDPLHFRMLLNQRLLDIHKSKNAAFVNSVAQMAYPFYYDSVAAAAAAHALYLKQAEQTTTLDLSMPNHRRQSDEKSDSQDDSNDGMASSDENDSDGSQYQSEKSSNMMGEKSRFSNSSSRRKPAAPQWVYTGLDLSSNTTEEDLEAGSDSDGEEIINGVCVRQTEDFGLRAQSEEMIRIEPAPAPDQGGNDKDDDKDDSNSEKKKKTDSKKDDKMPKDVTSFKLSDRHRQLEKLQERLQREDEEEDWEF